MYVSFKPQQELIVNCRPTLRLQIFQLVIKEV